MRVYLCFLLVVCLGCIFPAYAQSFSSLQADLDAKLEASQKELRNAIVKLKEVRQRSCSMGNVIDCDLVVFSDVELVLLDAETKYGRAGRVAASSSNRDTLMRAKEAASTARERVSDLIDILK